MRGHLALGAALQLGQLNDGGLDARHVGRLLRLSGGGSGQREECGADAE
jgi:hypothetical protein